MHWLMLIVSFTVVPITSSITCWGYYNLEYNGRVEKTDKIQVLCHGDYCMTISEEGNNFNEYNGTCPDNTVSITDCENRGSGCHKEKIADVYIKVCCCNTDLCNNCGKFVPVILVVLVVLFFFS